MRRLIVLCITLATLHTPAWAQDKLSLMTDWAPYGGVGPLFLAKQKGWLSDAGIDLTIMDGKGSTTTIQLVAAGTIDVGYVQLASMAGAMDQGMALTSIACFIRAGDNGIIIPEGSTIKVPKDLVGKRIVYPLGGASAGLMEAFFTTAHLSRNDFTLVGVDSSALASTYVAGGVDAAVATTAYLMPMIEDKRPSHPMPYSSVGLIVPSFGLAVRSAEVTSRAALFARLVPVIDRAYAYALDGHIDEAVDDLIAGRPNERLDRTVLKNQLTEYLKLVDTPASKGHPMGWQAESDWVTAIAAMKAAGMIKKDRPIGDYYTNQFVK